MNKKIIIIIGIIAMLVTGGYLYLRYSVLETKDFKPDTKEAVSVLDLRPALIAKLQQLVKDGSNGLYVLTIGSIDPSVTASTLDATDVKMVVDSAVLSRLDSMQMAPDNVYNISLKMLHIDGLGLKDLINKNDIKLESIKIDAPHIAVFTKKRSYNAAKKDTLSLFEKINKEIKSLSIGNIIINNAQVSSRKLETKGKPTLFKGISIRMKNLLIDSTTQYDKDRFLFAKEADISLAKYAYRTSDSLYFLNSGSINISATRNTLTAQDIEFIPRHSKAQFQKRNTERKDRMEIKIPKLVLSGIDWWLLANYESIIADRADIYNCRFEDYIDKSMPPKKLIPANYPHQALQKIPIPIAVNILQIHDMNLSYDEYNPLSEQQGTVYFSRINGTVKNLTNIKANASRNRYMTLKAKALFMKSVPTDIELKFDLAGVSTGAFEANVHTGKMNQDILNPLSEPLAMFHLKTVDVEEVTSNIKGDNNSATAGFTMLYDNLYIIPLKKDADKKSGIDKQRLLGFLANLIKIKSANPGDSKTPRTFNYVVKRNQYPGFFTHLWKTVLFGVIKTIGAPEKLAK